MHAEVDGLKIEDTKEFHRAIAKALQFPAHYGLNLDALWDVLSGSLERPAKLVWRNSAISREKLPDFEAIVSLMREVEAQDIAYGWKDRFEFVLD